MKTLERFRPGSLDLGLRRLPGGRVEGFSILAVVGLVSVFHAWMGPEDAVWNALALRAYYLPVLWAAVRGGGLWGGGSALLAAGVHTVVMLDHGQQHGFHTGHPAAFFPEHWMETPVLILIGWCVGVLVDRERRRREERDRARRILGRYLSTGVAEHLLQHELDQASCGILRKMTVMFTDLRGFTSLTESVGPRGTVALLNDYFGLLAAVIARYGGTIDKLMGDGAMVLFGFPLLGSGDAARAVLAGVSLERSFPTVRDRWKDVHGMRMERVGLGIGIATGEVIIGDVGSASRLDFTCIGDTVNLASRLCAGAPGGAVLLDQATYRDARGRMEREEGERIAGPIELEVRGMQRPVPVYEWTSGSS